ncbi:MAG: tripartite tricarboxylate transporter TctB family protein [Burkholderiales bacterium]
MSEQSDRSDTAVRGIRRRTAEIAVAAILFALGSLVVFDSRRLGSSWGSDGPEAGYFPFYIGLIICISSTAILAQAIFGRSRRRDEIFVEWQPLRQVMSILVPAVFFVLAIQLIGLYVAAAVYIAGFMLWLGGYGVAKSVGLGVIVSALAFVTFEIWFQVPLYKGAFDPLWFLGY